MSNLEIIWKFHYNETQSMNHSEEYLSAILEVETLEDLCEEVSMWVQGITSTSKAAVYILSMLDD